MKIHFLLFIFTVTLASCSISGDRSINQNIILDTTSSGKTEDSSGGTGILTQDNNINMPPSPTILSE